MVHLSSLAMVPVSRSIRKCSGTEDSQLIYPSFFSLVTFSALTKFVLCLVQSQVRSKSPVATIFKLAMP